MVFTIKNFNGQYKYLTYTLNQTQSNPASMVTATSADSQSMSASDVINFIGAYPVLLSSDGKTEMKLNPDNFQQFEDGTDASNYTASTGYDVMIKFPRRGYKISTTSNVTTFTLTDDPNNSEYSYLPFQRLKSGTLGSDAKFQDASCFYLGAYPGYVNSSILRSWYNKTPSANATIGTFSGYAHSHYNGLGGLPEFLQYFYLEMCFMAIYKTTNAQSALGRGYVDASGSSYPGPATGTATYDKGMNYGTTSGTVPVKFLGLEHWYGGVWGWINGRGQDSSGVHISIPTLDGSNRTSSYSYAPTGNINVGSISLTNGAYITKVMGGTYGGFTPTNNSGGSETTYFTDYARRGSGSRVAIFGGQWAAASECGAFDWGLDGDASGSGASIGGRLMFLPTS